MILDYDDLEIAFERWCEYYHLSRTHVYDPAFKQFAKIDVPNAVLWAGTSIGRNIQVSEETAKRLALLNSPHWKALLRAWEIQHNREPLMVWMVTPS